MSGNNDLADVVAQIRLEFGSSFATKQEVPNKSNPLFNEAFVERFFAHGLEKISDRGSSLVGL
jgi:hypothetical protein